MLCASPVFVNVPVSVETLVKMNAHLVVYAALANVHLCEQCFQVCVSAVFYQLSCLHRPDVENYIDRPRVSLCIGL